MELLLSGEHRLESGIFENFKFIKQLTRLSVEDICVYSTEQRASKMGIKTLRG